MKNIQALPVQAQKIIERLGLEKTYEGIYLKRVYEKDSDCGVRPEATSVYGLAAQNAPSLLHRLDCDELWHYYDGHSLNLYLLDKGILNIYRLGPNVLQGEQPLVVIPKGVIFGAAVKNKEDWCLFGCTCIPGFAAANCEFIEKGHPQLKEYAGYEETINLLTGFAV